MTHIAADSILGSRGLFMQSMIHRRPILTREVLTIAAAMLLVVPTSLATADTLVVDLPLEDGGSQRVLYASPARPRAALIMLPGGNGIVEIGNDGSIRRMGGNFLLRTLPLWQAQGFAVAVLSPPNGMSLLGHRHTPAYAATIGQAVDFVRSVRLFRSGSSAPARARSPRLAQVRGSAGKWRGSS
jgi:hypothetical protein